MSKKKGELERKYSVDFYLEKKDHPNEIKRMMKVLYLGKYNTLEKWEEIDNGTNKVRC